MSERFDQWVGWSWRRDHCSAHYIPSSNCDLLVNTRQQTERDPKKDKRSLGTLEQMCQVVKEEGWERLYGGFMPSLVGTAPSQGVYYYFYEIFRNKAEAAALKQKKIGIGDGSVGMISSPFVAALSGRIERESNRTPPGQGLLVATEQTILSAVELLPCGARHVIQEVYDEAGVWGFWKGTWDAIIKMISYEGFYGFYKGMGTKIVQSVLAAAVLFMVKEELVKGVHFLLAKDAANTVKPKHQ